MKRLFLLFGLLIAEAGSTQPYSLSWYKIASGGGSSAGTNGSTVFSVNGTIGQHDAGGAMRGDGYSLTGGFWSLISVVQTPGVPDLTIERAGNSVIVAWPNTGTYVLQQNGNLAASAAWATSGYTVTTNSPAGTNSITITPPSGSLFFRLANH
jgi:hypothetical protein